MSDEIEAVRRFNRTVTQALGIFGATYLGRPRPFAASRLLFEIGRRGAELRNLRRRLGLDSGYLSRLMRLLERESLVRLTAAAHDRRVRRAVLTERGLAELDLLNRLSDREARALLDGIRENERAPLLAAMNTVQRLLVARLIELERVDAGDPRVQPVLDAYFAELTRRFDRGFDPGEVADASGFAPPAGLFLLATLYGEAVGCGGLLLREGYAEIKRMWVDPAYRGTGTGSRLLTALEGEARRLGRRTVRLDTNRRLSEAQGLYRRAGYRPIERYNDNPYAQVWYEKRLSDELPPGP